MSTKRGRLDLKTYFETGDRPTEEEFAQLIDSNLNQKDDDIHAKDRKIGIGTDDPNAKLDVNGEVIIRDNTEIKKSLLIGTDSGMDNIQVGKHINKVVVGSSYGADTGWSAGYIGFNTKYRVIPGSSIKAWLFSTDGFNNGGALIRSTVGGNLNFYTVPRSAVAEDAKKDRLLADNDLNKQQRMQISGNGNVGIGVGNAVANLEIGGESDAEASNGILQLGEANDRASNMNLRFGVVKGDRSWIQSHLGPLYINKLGRDTILNLDASNVGIGISNPDNKLVVDNGSNSNTGLKLPTGAGSGRVLVSNNDGDASWEDRTSITNGLWKNIGGTNHIENGNSGYIGIGTNDPKEKLHIKGSLKIEGNIHGESNVGMFKITSDSQNGGAYIELFSRTINHDNQGGMTFVSEAGSGNKNGFTFLNHNPGEVFEWTAPMRIQHNGYVGIGISNPKSKLHVNGDIRINDNTLYLRPGTDENHGIEFLEKDKFDNVNQKRKKGEKMGQGTGAIIETPIDGAFVFGHSGGALGSNRSGSKNMAMQWFRDKRVDFKDRITSNGKPFCIRKRFFVGEDTNRIVTSEIQMDGYHKGKILKYPVSDWTAMIVGFQYDSTNIYNNTGMVKTMLEDDGINWVIHINLPGGNNDHYVDILFIRNEMF